MIMVIVVHKVLFYALVVMGPGQKILTWVRSAIYGLGLNLENFP